jgi:hypothetical protein
MTAAFRHVSFMCMIVTYKYASFLPTDVPLLPEAVLTGGVVQGHMSQPVRT